MQTQTSAPISSSVLIVDDEAGPRQALTHLLESHFRIFTAASGQEALELMQDETIDVVTLDLRMPGLGGIETFARMRELQPDVEVVIITGAGSYESATEAIRLRAFDYVPKPFEAKRVFEIVAKADQNRRRHLSETESVESLADQLVDRLQAFAPTPAMGFNEQRLKKFGYIRLLAVALQSRLEEDSRPWAKGLVDELDQLSNEITVKIAGHPLELERIRGLARRLRSLLEADADTAGPNPPPPGRALEASVAEASREFVARSSSHTLGREWNIDDLTQYVETSVQTVLAQKVPSRVLQAKFGRIEIFSRLGLILFVSALIAQLVF